MKIRPIIVLAESFPNTSPFAHNESESDSKFRAFLFTYK